MGMAWRSLLSYLRHLRAIWQSMDVFRKLYMPTGHNEFVTPVAARTLAWTDEESFISGKRRVSTMRQRKSVRALVLCTLSHSIDQDIDLLLRISEREWKRLLTWLDVSGLALYFFDRMREMERLSILPPFAVETLERNLRDNTERTRGMIAESIVIQHGFQSEGVRYAVLKGVSLCPAAVSRPELRHQFDLDYLIARTDAGKARTELERLGYRAHALGERCWEFKKGETPHVSVKDLYKDLDYRGVELHLDSSTKGGRSQLENLTERALGDVAMPLLAPVDLFIAHAMDVFKDVCSSYTRASHLLEYYRHVLANSDVDSFWAELRHRVAGDRKTKVGIAVVSYLAESLLGKFAPEALTKWTVAELSPAVRLWIERYGHDSVLADPPGTKLYLLLQKELELEGVLPQQKLRTSLLPTRLPKAPVRGSRGEDLSTRIARYTTQVRFVLSRLRFHCAEGTRFALESYRWNRQLEHLR